MFRHFLSELCKLKRFVKFLDSYKLHILLNISSFFRLYVIRGSHNCVVISVGECMKKNIFSMITVLLVLMGSVLSEARTYTVSEDNVNLILWALDEDIASARFVEKTASGAGDNVCSNEQLMAYIVNEGSTDKELAKYKMIVDESGIQPAIRIYAISKGISYQLEIHTDAKWKQVQVIKVHVTKEDDDSVWINSGNLLNPNFKFQTTTKTKNCIRD